MKNKLLLLLAVLFIVPAASAKDFGLGIILFGPTGISTNYFLDSDNSIDGALSWSLNDGDQNIYLHSTYLWHKPRLLRLDKVALDVYFGGGGRLISWDDPPGEERDPETHFGVRGVAGIGHTFKNPCIELFGEISMTMDVIPETDADLDLGLGARFYF